MDGAVDTNNERKRRIPLVKTKEYLYFVGIFMKKAFSLALGGGAARGIAHIGVIRKLEQLGQKPVMVSGTSIGAIVAALYACGYTADEMAEIAQNLKIRKLIDLDLVHGILKGKKILAFLGKYF
jgi:NTE family protein